MLHVFFTIVYFSAFFKGIDFLFRRTLGILPDILAVVCLVIVFVASVGLADYTVRKIRETYGKQ